MDRYETQTSINDGVSIRVLASLTMNVKDQVFLCLYYPLSLNGILVRLSVKDLEEGGSLLMPWILISSDSVDNPLEEQ